MGGRKEAEGREKIEWPNGAQVTTKTRARF